MTNRPANDLDGAVPTDFSLSVLMQRSPSASPWQDDRWEAIGVTAKRWDLAGKAESVSLVHEQGEIRQYLYPGFRLRLYADECESYYHNLCAPDPHCFVIANNNGEGVPVPFLVSLSFDEANAYQEGDEEVYTVAMPPELYRWCELFVLNHYVPEKKKKRHLTDWRKEADGGVRP
ncbi:DUF3305 domain-containing protein [Sedimenticola sp.]|uniref:DUF3305 domain-containing protein n=1 Tax=Sedimenticola sp. TaxID=1940285 RepID=UPI003D0D3E29